MVGESKAIARYLSKQLGLFGANDGDAAKIDAICEHIVDIQVSLSIYWVSGFHQLQWAREPRSYDEVH